MQRFNTDSVQAGAGALLLLAGYVASFHIPDNSPSTAQPCHVCPAGSVQYTSLRMHPAEFLAYSFLAFGTATLLPLVDKGMNLANRYWKKRQSTLSIKSKLKNLKNDKKKEENESEMSETKEPLAVPVSGAIPVASSTQSKPFMPLSSGSTISLTPGKPVKGVDPTKKPKKPYMGPRSNRVRVPIRTRVRTQTHLTPEPDLESNGQTHSTPASSPEAKGQTFSTSASVAEDKGQTFSTLASVPEDKGQTFSTSASVPEDKSQTFSTPASGPEDKGQTYSTPASGPEDKGQTYSTPASGPQVKGQIFSASTLGTEASVQAFFRSTTLEQSHAPEIKRESMLSSKSQPTTAVAMPAYLLMGQPGMFNLNKMLRFAEERAALVTSSEIYEGTTGHNAAERKVEATPGYRLFTPAFGSVVEFGPELLTPKGPRVY